MPVRVRSIGVQAGACNRAAIRVSAPCDEDFPMKIILMATAAMLVALPALAQGVGGPGRNEVRATTRADVQSRTAAMFARTDANRDGFVSRNEAEAGRAAMRAQRPGRRAGGGGGDHFGELDRDGNGLISRAEFDAHHAAGNGDRAERRAERQQRRAECMQNCATQGLRISARAFDRLDTDRDNRLSLTEAQARPLARFAAADTNRDGSLTRDERRAAREKMQGRRQQRRGS